MLLSPMDSVSDSILLFNVKALTVIRIDDIQFILEDFHFEEDVMRLSMLEGIIYHLLDDPVKHDFPVFRQTFPAPR